MIGIEGGGLEDIGDNRMIEDDRGGTEERTRCLWLLLLLLMRA
jgi:hypothetical protein